MDIICIMWINSDGIRLFNKLDFLIRKFYLLFEETRILCKQNKTKKLLSIKVRDKNTYIFKNVGKRQEEIGDSKCGIDIRCSKVGNKDCEPSAIVVGQKPKGVS